MTAVCVGPQAITHHVSRSSTSTHAAGLCIARQSLLGRVGDPRQEARVSMKTVHHRLQEHPQRLDLDGFVLSTAPSETASEATLTSEAASKAGRPWTRRSQRWLGLFVYPIWFLARTNSLLVSTQSMWDEQRLSEHNQPTRCLEYKKLSSSRQACMIAPPSLGALLFKAFLQDE